ncbi:MAG: hypothetical protein IT180_14140, partial [Acidobacteria bacterium]|nr:hypothetical protein [Acidobacteriota bacterium]
MSTDRQPDPPKGHPPVTPPGHNNVVFLEGPHSRLRELLLLLRAGRDFLRGFRTLHFVGPCVT